MSNNECLSITGKKSKLKKLAKFTFSITSLCNWRGVIPQVSYLIGFFDNLMEGGEDAESTTMVVEVVKGEWEGGQDDRQTDRESVQVQEYGVQIHTRRRC